VDWTRNSVTYQTLFTLLRYGFFFSSEGCRYLSVASERCYGYGLNKCGRCTLSCHVTPPLLSPVLIPHHSAVTTHSHTTHTPATSVGRQEADSDIDTHRVMVDTNTRILITDSNLNDFQLKINSINERFMVNSLSLNLKKKTFYCIKFSECTSI
jgi:hypothetical protein